MVDVQFVIYQSSHIKIWSALKLVVPLLQVIPIFTSSRGGSGKAMPSWDCEPSESKGADNPCASTGKSTKLIRVFFLTSSWLLQATLAMYGYEWTALSG